MKEGKWTVHRKGENKREKETSEGVKKSLSWDGLVLHHDSRVSTRLGKDDDTDFYKIQRSHHEEEMAFQITLKIE